MVTQSIDLFGVNNLMYIIIAMGSVSGTIEETVDALNKRGRKTGFLQIRIVNLFNHFFLILLMWLLPVMTLWA